MKTKNVSVIYAGKKYVFHFPIIGGQTMKLTKCFTNVQKWRYVSNNVVYFWGSLGAYIAHCFNGVERRGQKIFRIRKNGKIIARSATYQGI